MEEINLKSILKAFIEQVWNKGNFTEIKNFITPEYEIKSDPGDPWNGQILGYNEFEERVSYSRNAFPDLHFEIKDMIEENGKVVLSWIVTGTHVGDLPQLPASGKQFSVSGLTIYYFQGSKVCGHTQTFDRLGFLSQIGFLGGMMI